MKKLAILGLGHIGSSVYKTLKNNYNLLVKGYDLSTGHDLSSVELLTNIINKHDGVLACTPFFLNKQIASLCNDYGVDYFDLTESVDVTNFVKTLTNARFITQCGLAPGMVSIIANHLASQFTTVEDISIRVGALPQDANNHMQYYRTWNTEGLINEYIHSCPAIQDKKLVNLQPLSDQETITFNGLRLEAANTSGGLGSLAETYLDRANNVNYKTLRYPGHWDHMRFLKNDLDLADNFETFVKIFNNSVPICKKDCVYIYISVTGYIGNEKEIKTYSKVIYSDDNSTAIQKTTAGGVMAVIDVWAQGMIDHKKGWIKQEELDYHSIFASRYSESYKIT